MAIVTSNPDKDNKVKIYDVPDADLQKYELSGDKAASMFPEGDPSSDDEGVTKIEMPEAKGDVQAYQSRLCRRLICNAAGCGWFYWVC
jgi:uncharacterized protein (DUF2236 family)